jgi:hypothetical protein
MAQSQRAVPLPAPDEHPVGAQVFPPLRAEGGSRRRSRSTTARLTTLPRMRPAAASSVADAERSANSSEPAGWPRIWRGAGHSSLFAAPSLSDGAGIVATGLSRRILRRAEASPRVPRGGSVQSQATRMPRIVFQTRASAVRSPVLRAGGCSRIRPWAAPAGSGGSPGRVQTCLPARACVYQRRP